MTTMKKAKKATKATQATNRAFAQTDPYFKKACAAVGLEPTTRQASKFRRGRGLVWRWGW